MAIKNYTTKVPAAKTVGEIQALLAKHGAQRVSIDYGENGRVLGVTFSLATNVGMSVFRLPSKIEAMKRLLAKQKVKCTDEHAEAVAWRNIKDWIDAQIALIETGLVEANEVMLPYMLDRDGCTMFESVTQRMLQSGDDQ